MNLIIAISPLTKLFSLVGLFPMGITANGNLQITNKGIFGSLLAFTIVVIHGIKTSLEPNYKNILATGSTIALLVRALHFYSIICISGISLLLEVVNRKRIHRIITSIQDIDNFISSNIDVFRIKIDYNLLRRKTVTVIAAFIVCHVFVIVQDFVLIRAGKDFVSVARVFLIYYTPFTILSLMIIKFIWLCFLINQRIFWINGLLYNSSNLEEMEQNKAFNFIFWLHNRLYRISNDLNASYSVQIVLCVAQTFLVMTMQCFYIVLLFVEPDAIVLSINVNRSSYSRFIWNFYQILLLFLLVHTCYKTSQEGTRTGEILYTVVYRQDAKNLSENTKMMLPFYSLQILHCSPRFSAAGFFNIDMALIQSMIASITTYLVILIQINLSQRKN